MQSDLSGDKINLTGSSKVTIVGGASMPQKERIRDRCTLVIGKIVMEVLNPVKTINYSR